MFEEKYNNLTGAEKENFKRITSLLLNRTFMVNRFYDKNQGTFRSNSDYRFIDRNIDLFREYLEIAGYRLLKDSNYEVIYIENEYEYNKKRLDKNTTIFLYGLRLIGRRTIVQFAKKYPKDYPEPETVVAILKKGFKVAEIPVVMRERQGGSSSITLKKSVYYMVKVTLAILFENFRGDKHR